MFDHAFMLYKYLNFTSARAMFLDLRTEKLVSACLKIVGTPAYPGKSLRFCLDGRRHVLLLHFLRLIKTNFFEMV